MPQLQRLRRRRQRCGVERSVANNSHNGKDAQSRGISHRVGAAPPIGEAEVSPITAASAVGVGLAVTASSVIWPVSPLVTSALGALGVDTIVTRDATRRTVYVQSTIRAVATVCALAGWQRVLKVKFFSPVLQDLTLASLWWWWRSRRWQERIPPSRGVHGLRDCTTSQWCNTFIDRRMPCAHGNRFALVRHLVDAEQATNSRIDTIPHGTFTRVVPRQEGGGTEVRATPLIGNA